MFLYNTFGSSDTNTRLTIMKVFASMFGNNDTNTSVVNHDEATTRLLEEGYEYFLLLSPFDIYHSFYTYSCHSLE